MISVSKQVKILKTSKFSYDFKGLSTDEKLTVVDGEEIGVNSMFLELDTGKFYYYDGVTWTELGQEPTPPTPPTPAGTLILDKTITDLEEGYPGTGIYIETSTFDVPLPTDITVVWDGTEYECTDDGEGYFGAPLDFDNMTADFSTYPFALAIISSNRQTIYVVTDDDSTHTIKIYGETE